MTRPSIRPAAVAGFFYPDDPEALRAEVRRLLDQVTTSDAATPPKALVAPHAGYVYSGPIAAAAYAELRSLRGRITRIVLMGPAHRTWVQGMATVSSEAFATPLGDVPVDRAAVESLLDLPQVVVSDEAHRQEHSLEVHLPFLLELFEDFAIVPLAVGGATPAEVAEVLERLWGGPETLILISSDLSHYKDYATARQMDAATTEAIEQLNPDAIGREDACGRVPIRGLLTLARQRGLRAETMDLRNSGDTAGHRLEVVGYGSYVFRE
ncbi:MAG: AmmeMemoRadiSam system protein B [Myxococcota bacterium]|jgi:hypothetical protein|nr:AmmeMemoRadiSam system protein B [Myxococcota bacterium]